MLETFKVQLKAAAVAAGAKNLSNKRIDEYSAKLDKRFPNLTLDDDHKKEVDNFLEFVNLKEIASYDDQQRNKSTKKEDTKNEGGSGADKKDETTTPETETPGDDTPSWAKALIESNKTLAADLAAMKQKESQLTIRQKAAEALKDVPEVFWGKRVLPVKEEELEGFVTEAKADYSTLEQTRNNNAFSSSSTPFSSGGSGGSGGEKKVDADVLAFAKRQSESVKPKV